MQFDLIAHLTRQAAFSRATFGPGARTNGVLQHLEQEIEEVRSATTHEERSKEWTDLVILSLDGLLREVREGLKAGDDIQAGFEPTNDRIARDAVACILAKQAKNELRDRPDWRSATEDQAINHVRREEDDG